MENKEPIGEKIYRLRKEKKLNILQLAYIASVSPTTISMLERGKIKGPHFDTLRKLAKALETNLDVSF